MSDRCTIVAECGINHGGSLTVALDMVEAAKKAGADIAKFQTYIPERVLRRSDPDFDLLAGLALPFADFQKIAAHCAAVGIEFMSTPGDVESLHFLVDECRVKRIKIGSDDLTNAPLVGAAFDTGLPVILSTGMATDAEIGMVLSEQTETFVHSATLLHCVSLYPCHDHQTNLRRIAVLKHIFEYPVGYSDHTSDVAIPIYAAALGAVMIEKHFTLTVDTVDAAVSALPYDFAVMVDAIRQVEVALGDGGDCADHVNRAKFRKGADGLRGAA